MRNRLSVLLALAASPAFAAKPPTDWVRCDGYARPAATSESVGRAALVIGTLGLFGVPEQDRPEARTPGAAGVAACTAVLDGGGLGENLWARRINLLKARAIHQLEAGSPDAALADLAEVDRVAGPRADDAIYARSFGVAEGLQRALALAEKGDTAGSERAALAAAALRPWSLSVGRIAAALLRFDPPVGAGEAVLLDRLVTLDPAAREDRVAAREAAGDWAGVLADVRALPPVPDSVPPRRGADFGAMTVQETRLRRHLTIGFAAAMTRDETAARAEIAAMRAMQPMLEEAARTLFASPAIARANPAASPDAVVAAIGKAVDAADAMIEARLALNARRPADAAALLGKPLPWATTPAMLKLIDDTQAASPAAALDKLPTIARVRAAVDTAKPVRERINHAALFDALPQPEDRARLTQYSGQWGLGLKQSGFRTLKPKPGQSFITIEFTGTASSRAATEEMGLLRAAELARGAGKGGFVIVSRRDYTRTLTQTYGGAPIGRATPAGYQAQLDVEFVDPAAPPPGTDPARVIRADAVWSALAPLYVPAPGAAG